MRRSAIIFFICSSILTTGCVKSATTQQSATTEQSASALSTPGLANINATPAASASPAASQSAVAKGEIDPCSLLTSDDVRAVQGEPVKETKASRQATGGLVSLQCYYGLPTSSNSISLTLTETDPAKSGGTTAKQYWQQTFHGGEETERKDSKERNDEKEKARAQKPTGEREQEDETAVPPKPVSDVGDEAFWTASRFSGALYVLKAQRFIRISVGGPGDEETKLKKTKALAQKALRHL